MSQITYFQWLNTVDRRDTYQVHIRTALESDDLRALIEKALDPEPVTAEQIGLAVLSHGFDSSQVFDLVKRYRYQQED